MVGDLPSLLYVANLGTSRCTRCTRCEAVGTPDYLFFDLDPMEATFEQVLRVAPTFGPRRRARADRLPASGATGVQIYVPVDPATRTSRSATSSARSAG